MSDMHLRNGPHGYGVVTKSLHWLTVVLVLAQFLVGWAMDADDGGHGRGRGRGGESGRGRGRGGEDGYELVGLVPVHLTLGLLILLVAVVRVAWRLGTPLPPWAEQLGSTQRRLLAWSERGLLFSLFAIPLTGAGLLLSGDDDLLPLHIAAHLFFAGALVVHLSLVLGKRLLPRML
jgi:cytochrome b561